MRWASWFGVMGTRAAAVMRPVDFLVHTSLFRLLLAILYQPQANWSSCFTVNLFRNGIQASSSSWCPDLQACPLDLLDSIPEIEQGDVLLATENFGGILYSRIICQAETCLPMALLVVEIALTTHKSLTQLVAEDEAELGRMHSRREYDLTPQLHKHSGHPSRP